jgi:NTE family protein
VRLPWDYRRIYGLDPDEQPVADAVRASMSIPFLFRPVTLTSTAGVESTLVDGGLLSNFPIDSLNRIDRKKPRWLTFGVTVVPSAPHLNKRVIAALQAADIGAAPLLLNVVTTTLFGHDQAYLNQPWVGRRAIRVNTGDVGFLDFDISQKTSRPSTPKAMPRDKSF